jgi:5-methylcytosine-specific restriction endonuclease McrA
MVALCCSTPRCPYPAVRKGKCALHRQPRDGYSAQWRRISLAVRREVGRCEECGTWRDLTTDHIRPGTLGGSDARANLRVLCRSCHARIGAKG